MRIFALGPRMSCFGLAWGSCISSVWCSCLCFVELFVESQRCPLAGVHLCSTGFHLAPVIVRWFSRSLQWAQVSCSCSHVLFGWNGFKSCFKPINRHVPFSFRLAPFAFRPAPCVKICRKLTWLTNSIIWQYKAYCATSKHTYHKLLLGLRYSKNYLLLMDKFGDYDTILLNKNTKVYIFQPIFIAECNLTLQWCDIVHIGSKAHPKWFYFWTLRKGLYQWRSIHTIWFHDSLAENHSKLPLISNILGLEMTL